MSEPNSLFAKIHITKDNFKNFQKSKPKTPKFDNNWQEWWEWWNSKELYDNKTDLQESDLFCYSDSTNESIIEWWKEFGRSCAFSDYDIENEIWHFGIIMFSENYLDMIPALAFIKSVAELKKENNEDFAIIYNFWWGEVGEVNAYIKFENKEALFDVKINTKDDVNVDFMQYADNYLTKKMEDFEAREQYD